MLGGHVGFAPSVRAAGAECERRGVTHRPSRTPGALPAPNRFTCREEGTHNDLATLFLSSGHDTIIRLFSVGATPGQPWVRHFTQVRAPRGAACCPARCCASCASGASNSP